MAQTVIEALLALPRPPGARIDPDDLLSTFGAREIELLAWAMINRAIDAGTWAVEIRPADVLREAVATNDYWFRHMVRQGWVVPSYPPPRHLMAAALIEKALAKPPAGAWWFRAIGWRDR